MKIAITGPQGSGKTTLLKALTESLKKRGVELSPLPEITRTVRELGFSINEAGDDETQLMITTAHIQNILSKDNYIVDRCLLDGYVYTAWLNRMRKVSDYIADFAYSLLKRYFSRYDVVFYIPNEFALEDDGVRSINDDFRQGIANIFENTVDRLRLAGLGETVVTLTGSVEERVNSAEAILISKGLI